MSGVLIDSNIFVYAFDPADPVKHEKAILLTEKVIRTGTLVLSAQVLNEVAWTLLRRGANLGLGPEQVAEIVDDVIRNARIVPLTPDLTQKALTTALGHGLSFWDGLIWAAAHRHGLSTIYTEDFQHGREVEGVRFVNPFVD
ncbi:MAG TPA: PIN domain-containing protein [Thermoanaerobaculia bacterium]|nr:PIN domain-containing protein [Thermoanaerobaculia bacterium]